MRHGRVFGGAIALVVALWIGCWLLTRMWEDRGVFGDSFGAVNALFSGLAFAALVYTLQLQREDLELQRDELRQSREQLGAQAEAQRAQARVGVAQVKAVALRAAFDLAELEVTSKNTPHESHLPTYAFRMREIASEIDRLAVALDAGLPEEHEAAQPTTQHR